ncbi:hypothetical protein ZMO02_13580 [Zymomonas mobilis subsp. pomaceae]|uniref:Uncharacterized protein n=1 Tax=Zymomonas mobilis subsp. pomaceae (strain ATCC 29192 / DSM 22645 / JCM 10191 / CCUG 17912 / NBRC 13757 / NCIMB 11200 / NRRL B-4491 / Barker I) TaxID=579138 RepID=F8ET00_ZYMMT|nr:conserved hypothetical protein [Zymomonas mobilis subsp. pomaceae ATCC 29192]GEB89721.1 hypothetical protein ZMO02_13580 [Zymomonas mobilis subsp. pomaceae]
MPISIVNARGYSGYHSYNSTRSSTSSYSAPREHYTHDYYRQNGTHVNGYHATNPNSTKMDNWSTRGNVNPYTGQLGTKNPY